MEENIMKTPAMSLKAITIIFLTCAVCLPLSASAERGKGYRMKNGMHHAMGGRFGGIYCWKRTLTDKQRQALRKMKLAYKRQKYLLKAQMREARVQLAILITSNKPGNSAIDRKIADISKIKAKIIRLKVNKLIKIRRMLTPDQRLSFDMKVLKKAYQGKKHRQKRRYHRH
jgi:Spy/CpxP family protein refolding chaperone